MKRHKSCWWQSKEEGDEERGRGVGGGVEGPPPSCSSKCTRQQGDCPPGCVTLYWIYRAKCNELHIYRPFWLALISLFLSSSSTYHVSQLQGFSDPPPPPPLKKDFKCVRTISHYFFDLYAFINAELILSNALRISGGNHSKKQLPSDYDQEKTAPINLRLLL